MLFRCALWGGLAILLVTAMPGCTGVRDTGSATYLLPVLDENGQTKLEEVPLTTLNSPDRVEGAAAVVYLEPQMSNDGHFSGRPAQPKLAKSGSTFLPLNAESGMALSVYAFFEKMYFYEKRVLIESMIAWPRSVGIFKNPQVQANAAEENNAMYLGSPSDSYVLLPYTDKGRVALAFNYGVLGHEHFHAHFDHYVYRELRELAGLTNYDQVLALACPKTTFQYELIVLRQWNEGLADTYGALTSGIFNFMIESLSPAVSRDLTLPPVSLQSKSEIDGLISHNRAFENCLGVNPYFNGEQIARTLLSVAKNGDFPPVQEQGKNFTNFERAARYLVYRMKGFAAELSKRGWQNLETDFLFQYLFQDVQLSPASCRTLQQTGSNMTRYPQCGSL